MGSRWWRRALSRVLQPQADQWSRAGIEGRSWAQEQAPPHSPETPSGLSRCPRKSLDELPTIPALSCTLSSVPLRLGRGELCSSWGSWWPRVGLQLWARAQQQAALVGLGCPAGWAQWPTPSHSSKRLTSPKPLQGRTLLSVHPPNTHTHSAVPHSALLSQPPWAWLAGAPGGGSTRQGHATGFFETMNVPRRLPLATRGQGG